MKDNIKLQDVHAFEEGKFNTATTDKPENLNAI